MKSSREAGIHPQPEGSNIVLYAGKSTRSAASPEADASIRLRDGDIIFHLIPGEYWRLTNTCCGQRMGSSLNLFCLVEEQTLSPTNVRIYKSTRLADVLL